MTPPRPPPPPCPSRVVGRRWCFCLLTSLPLRNRVLTIKKKTNWWFLPSYLLSSSPPRSTWHMSRVLDKCRVLHFLFFVSLNSGRCFIDRYNVTGDLVTIIDHELKLTNSPDPQSTRALLRIRRLLETNPLFTVIALFLGGMELGGSGATKWRRHCYVLTNHVFVSVWDKSCVHGGSWVSLKSKPVHLVCILIVYAFVACLFVLF